LQAAANVANNRLAAPNILFVVTDGSPNRPWDAGDYPSDPDGWLNGANAAITAANAARAAGWFVKAIFVGAPDEGLPFSDNLAWVDAVMDRIGGGSHSTLADFTTLAAELLITTGCKPETGTIIIEKQTNPNGSNEEFEFEASWLDDEEFDGTFFLTDNESESWELPAGSYDVDEVDIPAGWTLTDVSGEGCNEDGKIYISLQAGETVHCTFTNTQRIPPPPPLPPSLTIDKTYTGNTGGVVNGVRVSNSGDVLTFTLAYTIVNPPVTGGIITDVLPAGLDYVAASATGNGWFSFASFDAGTRTLTWTAPIVAANGSVTYQVTVTAAAASMPQPLVNVATVDSLQTLPDDDTDRVFVQQVLAETGRPVITLPPTDSIQSGDGSSSNPGFGLLLALLAIAGIGLVAGLLVPRPGRLRREEARRR
jgi:uncharacterized repeat protein (TIGR01451 family)